MLPYLEFYLKFQYSVWVCDVGVTSFFFVLNKRRVSVEKIV